MTPDLLPPHIANKFSVDEGGCWAWTSNLSARGYGYLTVNGRSRRAHRVVYELLVSDIPDGLELDHLCRRRNCVNPQHLDPVTHQENMRRARKVYCKRGHELNADSAYIYPRDGRIQRQCKACIRINAEARRAARVEPQVMTR